MKYIALLMAELKMVCVHVSYMLGDKKRGKK